MIAEEQGALGNPCQAPRNLAVTTMYDVVYSTRAPLT